MRDFRGSEVRKRTVDVAGVSTRRQRCTGARAGALSARAQRRLAPATVYGRHLDEQKGQIVQLASGVSWRLFGASPTNQAIDRRCCLGGGVPVRVSRVCVRAFARASARRLFAAEAGAARPVRLRTAPTQLAAFLLDTSRPRVRGRVRVAAEYGNTVSRAPTTGGAPTTTFGGAATSGVLRRRAAQPTLPPTTTTSALALLSRPIASSTQLNDGHLARRASPLLSTTAHRLSKRPEHEYTGRTPSSKSPTEAVPSRLS